MWNHIPALQFHKKHRFISIGLKFLNINARGWENKDYLFEWYSYSHSKKKKCEYDGWMGN